MNIPHIVIIGVIWSIIGSLVIWLAQRVSAVPPRERIIGFEAVLAALWPLAFLLVAFDWIRGMKKDRAVKRQQAEGALEG